jgi:hypothetical protein
MTGREFKAARREWDRLKALAPTHDELTALLRHLAYLRMSSRGQAENGVAAGHGTEAW